MNPAEQPPSPGEPSKNADAERTKQVTVAGWTAGVSALFAAGALINQPTWPVAIGVAALSAIVAAVCCFMVRR